MESGAAAVSRPFLLKIAECYGVAADWLLHGLGPQMLPPSRFQETGVRIDAPTPGKPMAGDFVADGELYCFVRRLDLSLSAGSDLDTAEGAATERIALSTAWFLKRGLAADRCALVRVRGDSMDPTVPDGCLVLLNPLENTPADGGIFALRLEGELFVKRLLPDRRPDGRLSSLVLFSDNRAHRPFILRGEEMNALRLTGRVRLVIAEA